MKKNILLMLVLISPIGISCLASDGMTKYTENVAKYQNSIVKAMDNQLAEMMRALAGKTGHGELTEVTFDSAGFSRGSFDRRIRTAYLAGRESNLACKVYIQQDPPLRDDSDVSNIFGDMTCTDGSGPSSPLLHFKFSGNQVEIRKF